MIPVKVTNLYDESGDLAVAQAQGEGFTINWKVGDEYGAVMGDVLYAQINRLAAMAQREPLPDDMKVVMTHLIAAKKALDEAEAARLAEAEQEADRLARAEQGAAIDAAEQAWETP
jgi:hypothetical protein